MLNMMRLADLPPVGAVIGVCRLRTAESWIDASPGRIDKARGTISRCCRGHPTTIIGTGEGDVNRFRGVQDGGACLNLELCFA